MTLTQHARATLEAQIRRLEDQLALAIKDPAVDPVHDFRVAIRRLSASLRIFAHFFPNHTARHLRRALKPALAAAATVRDLDVDTALLLKLKLPPTHPLLTRMAQDRARAALAFTGQLYLLRSQEIPLAWLHPVSRLHETNEDASLAPRALLPPAAAGFFKAGRKTLARITPERLHAFRLAAKRFRYTLEVFRPFYGPVFGARLEKVREIQTILGNRQDCAVTAALLNPLAAADPQASLALEAVQVRAVHLERTFHRFWHTQFDAPGQELLWIRYLSRRPPRRSPRSTISGDCPPVPLPATSP
jgi:CHAD domain-containing protein